MIGRVNGRLRDGRHEGRRASPKRLAVVAIVAVMTAGAAAGMAGCERRGDVDTRGEDPRGEDPRGEDPRGGVVGGARQGADPSGGAAGDARRGADRADGAVLDSVAAAPDMTGIPPAPSASSPAPAETPATTAAPDTALRATPQELAALSAALAVPVAGVQRSQLRDTFTEKRGGDREHEALDIAAARGTPVLSATDGRLLRLFDSRPGGLMVYATDETERFILLYGHLDGYAPGLREGMRLERGQVIGYVGTTGNAPSDAPHLHFGILRGRPSVSWWEGVAVNPYPLLVTGRRAP